MKLQCMKSCCLHETLCQQTEREQVLMSLNHKVSVSPHKGVETTGQPSSYLIAKAKISSPKQQEEKTSKTSNSSGAVVTDFGIDYCISTHILFHSVAFFLP